MKNYIKDIIKGLSVLIIYLLSNVILAIIISLMHIDYNSLPISIRVIVSILYQGLILFLIVSLYHNTFKDNYTTFKQNFFNYIQTYIKYWFLAILLMVISNMIISSLGVKIADNEKEVIEAFHRLPLYTIISATIIAPILEETVFRLSIRKIIRNDYLFIILSGLLFGILHVAGSNNIGQLLYIIPYSIPGCIFAYTLVKSDNIFVPISLHFIHNAILMIVQIILVFK